MASDEAAHACPDEATLSRFAAGQLGSAAKVEVEAHVDTCDECRELIAELARSSTLDGPSPREYAEREAERTIGRYQIEEVLGVGGMGVVYTARDSELGRRVALKLVRGSDDEKSAERRARMLREATAMAALSSPHVVAVYDVGTHRDQVFIAMELVTGKTLRAWLGVKPRTWRQIVDVFVQAGRGLVAAHEAGIVHRDFKPDNVFVGEDGRVRVGDFGLAHAPAEIVRAPDGDSPATLTETGTVMGTIRYMAPEQLEGRRADMQSDQFAFCVSLFEALHGESPYPGNTAAAVLAAFDRGIARTGKPQKAHPRWLDRVVARGLGLKATERFASMKALVDALTHEPVRRRRIAIAATTASVALVATGAAYALGKAPASAGPVPCEGGRKILDTVWGSEAHARVNQVFAASPNEMLRAQGARITRGLDDYANAWLRGHIDACEATMVRGQQSPERMDLRMECLSERLEGLRALASELAVDKVDLWKAPQAIQALAPIADCADPKALALRHAPASSPADRAVEDQLRAKISTARAAGDLGNYTRGLALAQTALAEAKGREWFEAEAGMAVGKMLTLLVRGPEATFQLHAAAAAADASKHDRISAEARTLLVSSLGYTQSKPDEAAQMVPYAEASIRRLGGNPQLEANLLATRARVLNLATRYSEALPLIEKARDISERIDPKSAAVGGIYNTLSNTYIWLDRPPESLAAADRALEILEPIYGPDHPQVAMVLTNRGGVLRYLARYDESIASHQRAIAIREKAFGPDHVEVAAARTNLANTYDACGRKEEAYAETKRALEIVEKALPLEHSWTGTMRVNMVERMLDLGQIDETIAFATKILPEERKLRDTRSTTGKLLGTLAAAYVRKGRLREAWEAHREALAITQKAGDRESAADVLAWFGNALLETKRPHEALHVLGDALATHRTQYGERHHLTAAVETSIAEGQLAVGRRDLAVPLLERAIESLAKVPLATTDLERARAALERARRP